MSVDLPQPDSPTMPTMRRSGTSKLTSLSAWSGPASVEKVTFRSRMDRTVMPTAP
jgi:hypothetical protein